MANLEASLKKYRLNNKEYEMICDLLKREPKGVEWALFSALWSEHCSYKSSKVHLRKFFNKNARVLVSEGENSGVVDLGEGEKISFKMESHNHPSFIEPYQGAATGVGGILRDIFTMGARPIALANYLCFGEMDAPRMKTLVEGVVGGISGYGNCVGVPNITGFTEFHSSYNKNILVNAFALGVLYPGEELALSKAKGPGNLVVYVGAKTGRDGIHGASMASESFHEKSSQNRPTVQIGDPFFEKLLIESCLDVIRQDLVVAIQDMGAAGLISSSFEMASKGGVGLEMHLDKVPLRDSSLTPEDILLSESQERMLLVCEPSKLEKIQSIFEKWGLDAVTIGEVLPTPNMRLYWKGELLTEIHPDLLVENAPRYERPYKKHTEKNRGQLHVDIFKTSETLMDIVAHETNFSRKWIYGQYDQRVGAQTAMDCSNSIGAIRLESSKRALSVALGCRPHLMRLDSRIGALDAVLQPALQLYIKGFEPIALTDCLNFGSPENPEVMSEFVTSVESISEACKVINAPVISGNVSFYNQTLGQDITSTPSTGLVGLRKNIENIPSDFFINENEAIYLAFNHQITCSGRLDEIYHNKIRATSGDIDSNAISDFGKSLEEIANQGLLSASRLVGAFGLLNTLFKMSEKNVGFDIETKVDFIKSAQDLFFERLYEVILVTKNPKKLEDELSRKNIEFVKLGYTKKDKLIFSNLLNESIQSFKEKYENSFEERLKA